MISKTGPRTPQGGAAEGAATTNFGCLTADGRVRGVGCEGEKGNQVGRVKAKRDEALGGDGWGR